MFGSVEPPQREDVSTDTIRQSLSLETEISVGGFLLYAEAELHFSKESLEKYQSTLYQLERGLGRPLSGITREDIYRIKARFVRQKLSDNWHANTLLILKRFLTYLRDIEKKDVLDPVCIKPPKRKYREVIYLTSEEVERLVGTIKTKNADGTPNLANLRFRALVEMLLGSALRISELLSLDISQIDYVTRETKIVGKGGRERIVFFTARAFRHLEAYLAVRDDPCRAVFADQFGRSRLKRTDIWRVFERHRLLAGIDKKMTPHILRHTAATQLLMNGCPIGHIKEILGHARLETTCRYYLGVDHRGVKQAHNSFLTYDPLQPIREMPA